MKRANVELKRSSMMHNSLGIETCSSLLTNMILDHSQRALVQLYPYTNQSWPVFPSSVCRIAQSVLHRDPDCQENCCRQKSLRICRRKACLRGTGVVGCDGDACPFVGHDRRDKCTARVGAGSRRVGPKISGSSFSDCSHPFYTRTVDSLKLMRMAGSLG